MLDIDTLNRNDLNFIEIEKILNIKITNYSRICSLLNNNLNHTLFKINFPNNYTMWGINSISNENFLSKFTFILPFFNKKINDIVNHMNNSKKQKFLDNSLLFNSKDECLDFSVQEKLPSEFINAIINFINTSNSIDNLCILELDNNGEINIIDENLDDVIIKTDFVNHIIDEHYLDKNNNASQTENDYVFVENI